MVAHSSVPPLTVWLGKAMYTFLPGREVTIGRSEQCDVVLDAPGVAALVSRVHVVARVEDNRWVAVDQSRNGIFVDGRRVPGGPVADGQVIALGAANGPKLRFRVTAPSAAPRRRPAPPVPTGAPSGPMSAPPPAAARPAPAAPQTVIARVRPQDRAEAPGTAERFTGAVRRLMPPPLTAPPEGATTVGRLETNTIVVDDALASRVHATVTTSAAGLEIIDNRSSNGTFVNGQRVDRTVLHDDDVVTIGNTDLVVADGTLVPRPLAPQLSGLQVFGLGLTIDSSSLISDVSFAARPGSLTAVIGPSGAGKSTLSKLVGGAVAPSAGLVAFDGHDVHAEYASMRSRIGMVPQDDVVHRQLTVDQALRYAAELRLPPDTSAQDRQRVVDKVLDELELTAHKAKRIDKLSGGQRKRVSVAMELLTGPSLLILDEPTSGLDPALDRQVMTMLRQLADAGRVVLVVTHSLTYLTMCDQVLLLAPGGKTAFAGPPERIEAEMGTTDWADIFSQISTDPDGAHQSYLAQHPAAVAPARPALEQNPLGSPPSTSLTRQLLTVGRRQMRLIAADRGYFVFLALLPFVLGVLSLVVPGSAGLGRAAVNTPSEPMQILVLLNIAVVFLGTALTIRDLIGERAIFQREQAVGLSASAYLAAKIVVYSVAAAIQTAIVTAIVVIGKRPPDYGGALLGDGTTRAVIELYLALAATAIVSAIVGLALSSLARSTEQVLPMLVGVVMMSMVFAGGLVPVTGRVGLDQVSWLVPARWGYAATAATVDLRNAAGRAFTDDVLWHHEARWWLLDMAVLAVMALLWTGYVRWRLRLTAMARSQGAPAGGGRGAQRRALAISAVVVVAVLGAVGYAFWRGLPDRSRAPEPENLVEASGDLDRLLLDAAAVAPVVGAQDLVADEVEGPFVGDNVVPERCTAAVTVGAARTYKGYPFTGMAGRKLHEQDPPWAHQVVQSVAAFRSADDAQDFRQRQQKAWSRCDGKTVTVTAADGTSTTAVAGEAGADATMLTVSTTDTEQPDRVCRHAMTVQANVVIDVSACGVGLAEDAATRLATTIADGVG
ncbi:sensor domain-containing protein [Mycobacterium koreense]|uniref:Uncharacterized protein n=2 Tax=Mycolicibacillus koreensis TaxID=1069220 RepID=A0A7I7SC08_9MYCO|nr:sensor domain-containing protein [Mycolicibacillus koreensis]MCV7246826.1 sensor domain-containing protein [Mycolicibacillus koreensis]OSC35385.1 hypothetical protein B8W67_03045 [Mycolicibacillus koreensis]BBY54308.1 putative ABC transporter, ATP-binding protein [Mycolicibacillus koreensis]